MAAGTTRNLFIQIGGSASDLTIAAKAGKSALLDLGAGAEDVQATVRSTFEKLGGTVADQATAMEKAYARTFANIQATARTALKAPTPSTKGLVLDLSAAKREADQADVAATFLRTLSDAQARLVDTGAEASAAAKALAVSLELDAIGAEKAALAARESVLGLERLGIASGIAVNDLDEVSRSHGRMGTSGLIADHVMRSLADSIAAGQSPVRALAMELPRVTEAMQFMAMQSGEAEGAMGKFAGFMGGGWGIAITAAISVASVLASSLLDGAHAADADTKAHDALKDAVDRLAGAQASLNHMTQQGIVDDINAANSIRQREIATRGLLSAKLQSAQADLKTAKMIPGLPGAPSGAGMIAYQEQGTVDDLTKQLADNQKKIDDANKAMLTGATKLIQRRVEGETDPRSKANQSFQNRADALDRQFQSGKISPQDYHRQYLAATNTRDSTLESLSARDPRQRRPRADHTEQKALGADISFTAEEQKLRKAYLDAAQKTTANQDARDQLAKQEIEAERASTAKEIADHYGKGDYGKVGSDLATAHRDQLLALNDAAAKQKAQNVDTDRRSADNEANFAAAKDGLDAAIKLAEMQEALATTMKARRDLALKALGLEQQRDALEPAKVLADPKSTPAQIAKAQQDQAEQAALAPLQRQDVERKTAPPGQAFMQALDGTSISDSLQQVQVDGLGHLEDGLEGVLSGTKSVKAAFSDMSRSIIADLLKIGIEQEVIKPLANSLFGGSGAAGGGGILSLLGNIFGHADGGHITGAGTGKSDSILARLSNGEFVVNAASTKRFLPVLHAINDNRVPGFADGGLIGGMPTMPTLSSRDVRDMSRSGAQVTIGVQAGQLFEPYVASVSGATVSQAAPHIVAGGSVKARSDAAKSGRRRLGSS